MDLSLTWENVPSDMQQEALLRALVEVAEQCRDRYPDSRFSVSSKLRVDGLEGYELTSPTIDTIVSFEIEPYTKRSNLRVCFGLTWTTIASRDVTGHCLSWERGLIRIMESIGQLALPTQVPQVTRSLSIRLA